MSNIYYRPYIYGTMFLFKRTLIFVMDYYGTSPICLSRQRPHPAALKIMSDSIEFLTLTRCRDKLVAAFKLDAVTVANALVSNNLIPPAVSSEIGELTSSERKANRLVDCIFTKVEISRTHYNSFIAVLSQVAWLNDIVDILNSTYRKLLKVSSLHCHTELCGKKS